MRKRLAVVVVLGCLVMIARLIGPSVLQRTQKPHTAIRDLPRICGSRGLTPTLLVADLQADSLLWGRNLLSASKEGHIDLPRLVEGNPGIQGFTVFSTIPRRLIIDRNEDTSDRVPYIGMLQGWPLKTPGSPKLVALYQAERLQKFVEQSNGGLMLLRTRGDLASFLQRRQAGVHAVAALLGTEGAQPLEGNLGNMDALYAAGWVSNDVARPLYRHRYRRLSCGSNQGRTHAPGTRVGKAEWRPVAW